MPVKITSPSKRLCEGSTGWITISFRDETGEPVSPITARWTLTDVKGNVMNGLEDVIIPNPGREVTVVLSGDDLGVSIKEKQVLTHSRESYALRILTVNAVYSSTLGISLPLRDQLTFAVDLTAVDHDDL